MIKELFYYFFKRFTSTLIGSLIFYHLVLRNRKNINFVNFLTGKKIMDLSRYSTNTLAGNELKRLCDKSKKMADIIDLSFSYRFSLLKVPSFLRHKVSLITYQLKSELIEFLNLIDMIQPKVVLEIGTASGGTLFLISRFSSPDALLMSVDLPGGGFGGGYPFFRIPFYKSFACKRQKIVLLREDSHKLSTLQKIQKKLKNKRVDVLFIDGDHSYNGVRKDFELYSTLVKKNGIIVFHDIVVHPPEVNCEVNKFWNEIKVNYQYKEFVEDWDQEGYGIGILFKD